MAMKRSTDHRSISNKQEEKQTCLDIIMFEPVNGMDGNLLLLISFQNMFFLLHKKIESDLKSERA